MIVSTLLLLLLLCWPMLRQAHLVANVTKHQAAQRAHSKGASKDSKGLQQGHNLGARGEEQRPNLWCKCTDKREACGVPVLVNR